MIHVVTFPGLGLEFSLNRVAFHLFGRPIFWYGIIIASGMLLAVYLCSRWAPRFGIVPDHILDMMFFAVPAALVAVRAYYVIFNLDLYRRGDGSLDWGAILRYSDGGLAIYGAIISSVIVLLIFCKVRKVSFLAFADLGVHGLFIGQLIGRWGNFFNREAFGEETSSFLRMGLYNPVTGQTSYVHPTFLYESLWNLVGFLLLHFLSKGRKYDGQTALQYMAWYGAGRAVIEGLRTDSLYIPGTSLRVSQILAAVGCVVALVILAVQAVRKHDPSGLFVNRVAAGQAPEAPSEEQPGEVPVEEKKSLKDRFQTWLRT